MHVQHCVVLPCAYYGLQFSVFVWFTHASIPCLILSTCNPPCTLPLSSPFLPPALLLLSAGPQSFGPPPGYGGGFQQTGPDRPMQYEGAEPVNLYRSGSYLPPSGYGPPVEQYGMPPQQQQPARQKFGVRSHLMVS